MATKELLEARWKAIICRVIALLLVEVSATTFGLFKSALSTSNMQQLPQFLQQQIQQMTSTYDLYVWGNWFAKNGPEIMVIMAIVLGSGLIAGEVNKGTIFFLLGKPISRERVLLIKYAISALILLAISVVCGAALLVTAVLAGHPQNIGGVVISTLLLWLGVLFGLGLALMFSALFKDPLWPLICALVITVLTVIPSFIPGWGAWNLIGYWSSQSAYLSQGFPAKEFVICFVAALVPLILALALFRKRAY
jgi:ABC-type transport system involved in multi-copper enzyme maturation permease subunit